MYKRQPPIPFPLPPHHSEQHQTRLLSPFLASLRCATRAADAAALLAELCMIRKSVRCGQQIYLIVTIDATIELENEVKKSTQWTMGSSALSHASAVRCHASTVRCHTCSVRYHASTVWYHASTGRCHTSTVRCHASTVRKGRGYLGPTIYDRRRSYPMYTQLRNYRISAESPVYLFLSYGSLYLYDSPSGS